MSEQETRLNKFLASCGIGSRRTCDKLIQNGMVAVNGKIIDNPATRVTDDDFVKVEGKRAQQLQTEAILFNKPKGLVCSKNDEFQRETIYALIPPKYQHLNHVGRLDKESEGLLILTNDGDLAQKLTHPSKKIEKEYIVTTDQAFPNEVLSKFLKGVHTPEGKAQAKSVKRLSPRRVRIVLETGLKRQIRMMFQSVHVRVKKLVRVRIGTMEGNGLEPGKIEVLEEERLNLLFATPPHDSRATTLISQQEMRHEGKKQAPKKWSRPTSRSHDGNRASDRKPRSSDSPQTEERRRDDSRQERSDERPSRFSKKKTTSNRFAGKRSFSKPSEKPTGGKSFPKRNTSSGPRKKR